MSTLSLQGADPLRPRPPGGMGRGALLALGVHALLVVALAVAVNWRSQTPQTFSAELWSATPQVAAPRAVESTPAPPPPPPPPPPPAPAPRVATPAPPPTVDPQIAIEKARQDKEKADRQRAEREKAEREKAQRERQAKAEKEKAEREKAEAERERQAAAKAKAEAQAKREQQELRDKQAEEQHLAKQREDNLRRMMGQAGATGAPGSTGSALKDAAPSASYAGKLIAHIRPKIIYTGADSGSPAADVEVRASPTGTILSRRLVKSSGNKDWDDAVLRAIDRTAELPRDTDGRVPPVLVITFTP